jgi:hypothetical protein
MAEPDRPPADAATAGDAESAVGDDAPGAGAGTAEEEWVPL